MTSAAYGAPTNAGWPTGGQNLDNSRYQAAESAISAATASTLAPSGAFGVGGAFVTGGGDVSATPAVDGQRVYFPASNGKLFAIDRVTGATIWVTSIPDLTGIKTANGATGNDYARATPAIAGQVLVIGTQSGKFQTPDFAAARPDLAGAYVLGIDKSTGQLLWKTKVDTHFAAIVTQSAQVNGNTAYVGLASNEEAFANQDLSGGIPYTCCTFRGKLVALDVKTGQIKWATYMVPHRARLQRWGDLGQHARDRPPARRDLHHDGQQLLAARRPDHVRQRCDDVRGQAGLPAGQQLRRDHVAGHEDGGDQLVLPGAGIGRVEHRLRPARVQ